MTAQILLPTAENIAVAADALQRGDVVAMPTETVYGLAGNAYDETALAKIFGVKERPTFDPLICHVPAVDDAQPDWLEHLQQWGLVNVAALAPLAQERMRLLMRTFWPGPVTFVLPKQPSVPDLATSGLPTVAVRSPRHPVAQALLRAVQRPLAAPSANRFGRISPTSANHVIAELGERIGYVLEGGECTVGIESTVLMVEPDGRVRLLRPGGLSPRAMAEATGVPILPPVVAPISGDTPIPSPGLLASHYAPRKPLTLLPGPLVALTAEQLQTLLSPTEAVPRLGLLRAAGSEEEALARLRVAKIDQQTVVLRTLSATGDLSESARSLFGALRALDDDPRVQAIWAEPVRDDGGLGYAINDRLRRASHR